MRTIERDEWVSISNEAESLLWNVAEEASGAVSCCTYGDMFLHVLGLPHPYSREHVREVGWRVALNLSGIIVSTLGTVRTPVVRTKGTLCTGLVALAAALGPVGPRAEEVMALATRMCLLGMIETEAP